MTNKATAFMRNFINFMGNVFAIFLLNGCALQSAEEGNPALKLFSALGICLAAVFVIFFIVVKIREKE